MSPFTTFQSTLQMTHAIKSWLDAREGKDAIFPSISSIVSRIHEVLLPYCEGGSTGISRLDTITLSVLHGVEEALMRTAEHLNAWNSRRPKTIPFSGLLVFFSPDQAIKALKQDEQHLNDQLAILLFSIGVTRRSDDNRAIWTARGVSNPKAVTFSNTTTTLPGFLAGSSSESYFRNREVEMFWKDYIGVKVRPWLHPVTH
jgi:hypothetical protein